jgi:hypothetical protein
MKPVGIVLLSIGLLALTATPGLAQVVVSAKSGMVNFTEGQVLLNGQNVESSLTRYPDIKEGSVLRTEEGRAEVLLTPGVTLRLGENAGFKMISNRLIDTRLELVAGSAIVEADQISKDNSVTVVVNNAAVSLPKAGIYRFSFDPAQVKVFSGEAAVLAGTETTLVGAGRMCALGSTVGMVEKFNANETDALDHWSHRRGELMAMANVSGASSFSSTGAGSFNPGYFMGMGMPLMGCSGFGYMPFSYGSYYGSGFWSFNPWYGMYTYIPCNGMAYSPYGYGYWSPGKVQGVVTAPTTGTGIIRRGPGVTHGPVSSPGRVPLALAINGSHSPGFRGGTSGTSGYGAARSGYSGFAGGGSGGYSRGGSGWSSGASAGSGGGFSGSASHGGGGGGMAGGGAVSGGAISSGAGAGGGGASHR